MITSLTFTFFAVFPALAQADPKLAASFFPTSIFVSFLLTGALLAIGGTLLGIAIMRTRIWTRWTGLCLRQIWKILLLWVIQQNMLHCHVPRLTSCSRLVLEDSSIGSVLVFALHHWVPIPVALCIGRDFI